MEDDQEYYTTFVMENAQRKQTGMYKIHAKNEHGEDECEVEFVVLGPPSPPRGLPATLTVSDVHKEGCKISFKEPSDDGGVPIGKINAFKK